MKVAILGSGVIGTTTAWYLAKAGHEVVVVDRQPAAAMETSFANAGEISPGYASPWAAPGIPAKAIRWLLMKHAPLILRPAIDRHMLAWLVSMLRNCTAERYAINKARMVRLAEFSRDRLIDLRGETRIDYDQRSLGTLQLFRTQAQLDAVGKDIEVLRAYGIPYDLLDRRGCIAAEPGLAASKAPIAGGLRLPNDETGDCFKFTTALAALAEAAGVRFRFGTSIQRIVASGGTIQSVITDGGAIKADAYVVALGSHSPQLLAPLGLRLPVYPVKGYSITVPVVRRDITPVSTLLDESYKVAITRLGDRIRVGGMAEISGYDLGLHERRRQTLEHSLTSLFPEAGDLGQASFWAGLRPMTPDSTPVIGATRYPNLFLNTGHGTLGWTMACGSGHVVADMIGGKTPAIEVHDLGIARYGA
ncbi:D-amino acid dehydrogenase [Allosphingosinicella deserti]|uniref:D-amino acid dehydrogenase n=1 Tax=Allosphingosinicella deserti TaxID=2116704 RepID=A0A2P7QLY8_9SPHN|nr:D-amino acid dehydrogenase [Sphingomonas deserti]PSJ38992.1 D-amino acid dehydrogenase small subunit [Sphingomonas deserti]